MARTRKPQKPTFKSLAARCPSWPGWGGPRTLANVRDFLQSRIDRMKEIEEFNDNYTLYTVSMTLASANAKIDLKSNGMDMISLMGNIKNGYRREALRMVKHEIQQAGMWIDEYRIATRK